MAQKIFETEILAHKGFYASFKIDSGQMIYDFEIRGDDVKVVV